MEDMVEFEAFVHGMEEHLKTIDGYKLLCSQRGHSYHTAFLQNKETGNIIYISCSDVWA